MWETVRYTPEDLSEMIEMTRSYYGDIEIANRNYLKWQYEDNPAGQALIMLAKDPDQNILAGQYIVIPAQIQHGEHLVQGTLSLNTLTKTAYQGQGIFTGLAAAANKACAAEGFAFTYGFPNPNSYPGFIKKLGFSDLGNVPLLLRPLDIKGLIQKKVSPLLAPFSLPLKPFFRVSSVPYPDLEVFEVTENHLAALGVFWETVKNKYPIMGVRSASYLRWRYMTIPQREYKLYGVKPLHSDELLGYIVGRCAEVSSISSGMIVDFLVLPQHTQAADALIQTLLQFFVQNGMELAGSLMMNHAEEYRYLLSNGFFKCPKSLEPQPFPLIYRAHPGFVEDHTFQNFNNWFITMGDYDAI